MKKNYDLSLVLNFLKQIRKNNDRSWFNAHKSMYEDAFAELAILADQVLEGLRKSDDIETLNGSKSLFRIYNDVRFSKDKTPYKAHLGGAFRRATTLRRGGYYFHIEPGNSFVAGGFWGPNAADLAHIRQHLSADPEALSSIVDSTSFRKNFSALRGEQLKTSPRGYSSDDPAIRWLRYKQFLLRHDFSDQEVMNKDFHHSVLHQFQAMRPFLDYMSEILTTDLNGLPLPGMVHH